jgi:hypothetical protein
MENQLSFDLYSGMRKTDAYYSNLHPWRWRGSSKVKTWTRPSSAFNAYPSRLWYVVAIRLFRASSKKVCEFIYPPEIKDFFWFL